MDEERRSLFAVSSNQGGQFSALEQKEAKQLMDNQLTNAAGSNLSGTNSETVFSRDRWATTASDQTADY